jgi:hypothetical protein
MNDVTVENWRTHNFGEPHGFQIGYLDPKGVEQWTPRIPAMEKAPEDKHGEKIIRPGSSWKDIKGDIWELGKPA